MQVSVAALSAGWEREAKSCSSSRLSAVYPDTSLLTAPGLVRGHVLSAAATQPPSPGLPTVAVGAELARRRGGRKTPSGAWLFRDPSGGWTRGNGSQPAGAESDAPGNGSRNP